MPGGYGMRWLHELNDKRRAQIRRLHIDLGASRRNLGALLQLGLAPTPGYEEEDAQLGWRLVWVGKAHTAELTRLGPLHWRMSKAMVVEFADRRGWESWVRTGRW